jgi:hypothetical protein
MILLSEAQMRRIEPFSPLSHGVPRVDDRRAGKLRAEQNGWNIEQVSLSLSRHLLTLRRPCARATHQAAKRSKRWVHDFRWSKGTKRTGAH